MKLKIVSLNAWGGQMWGALAAWLDRLAPDVLCLQEVTRRLEPGPDWLRYGDAFRSLDQRADLFADVSARLPGHQARFAAAARGPLRDAEGAEHASEHGIAQWIAPQIAITEHFQRFVHGRFRAAGWGPEPVPRTGQASRLSVGQGRPLVVAHLHGLRDPDGKSDTPARAAQWRRLAGMVEALRRPGDAVVVAGDFNVLPDSSAFETLGAIGLIDLVVTRGHTDTRTSLYAKPQRYADYLLVSPEVEVLGFGVPALPEVSDHRPLIVEVGLN